MKKRRQILVRSIFQKAAKAHYAAAPRSYTGWKHSAFTRVLIVFGLIMVLISGAFLWLSRKAEHEIGGKALELAQEQMKTGFARLDEQIALLTDLGQYLCSNNDSINVLSNLPETLTAFELGREFKLLQEQFIQTRLTSPLIRDVRIHLASLEKTISTGWLSRTMDMEEYLFLEQIPELTGSVTLYGDTALLFFTSADINYRRENRGPAPYYLVFELDPEGIMKYLSLRNGRDVTVVWNAEGTFFLSDARAEDMLPFQDYVLAARNGTEKNGEVFRRGDDSYYVFYLRPDNMELNTARFLMLDAYGSIYQPYRRWTVLYFLFVTAAMLLFVLMLQKTVRKPVHELVGAFRKVQDGDFEVSLSRKQKDEFSYLYHRFDRMLEQTRKLIEQVYEQTILSQRAELKQLQSQINPHFLYNSFFTISLMARQNKMDFVRDFTELLGRYLQFVVRNDTDMIALAEEVGYARLYARIQMTRFADRIQIDIPEVPEEFAGKPVPKLILQPLIENSLQYGLEKKEAGGMLTVRFLKMEGGLRILVSDNGGNVTDDLLEEIRKRMENKEPSGKMSGLYNINRRLVIQFGHHSGVHLTKNAENGLTAELCLIFDA